MSMWQRAQLITPCEDIACTPHIMPEDLVMCMSGAKDCFLFARMQDTVEIVMFNVLPQLVDIVAACTYLAAAMQVCW
eukprot:1049524-Pelagomonas_calceolata.AAC.1